MESYTEVEIYREENNRDEIYLGKGYLLERGYVYILTSLIAPFLYSNDTPIRTENLDTKLIPRKYKIKMNDGYVSASLISLDIQLNVSLLGIEGEASLEDHISKSNYHVEMGVDVDTFEETTAEN